MPVVVVATDVDTGEPVVFREGELRDAVRASCSFPGVFPPFPLERAPPRRRRRVRGRPRAPAREMAGEQAASWSRSTATRDGRWPAADSFVAIALRAGLTLLRGRTRGELAGRRPRDRPRRSASRAGCGRSASRASPRRARRRSIEALPELRRLLGALSRGGGVRRGASAGVRVALLTVALLLAGLALYDRPPGDAAGRGWPRPASRPVTRPSTAAGSATCARGRGPPSCSSTASPPRSTRGRT